VADRENSVEGLPCLPPLNSLIQVTRNNTTALAHAFHNAITPNSAGSGRVRCQEPTAGNSLAAAMGDSGGLMSYGTNFDDLVPLTRIC
jgi:hypothetical protein